MTHVTVARTVWLANGLDWVDTEVDTSLSVSARRGVNLRPARPAACTLPFQLWRAISTRPGASAHLHVAAIEHCRA